MTALHTRFLRGLELAGDGPAVAVHGEVLSYRQMHRTALHWAGALRAGAVGVLAEKGTTAYLGVLATLYAGAAVVPLQPGFPPARTGQMLAAADPEVLIADEAGLAALRASPELVAGRMVLAPGAKPEDLAGLPALELTNPLPAPRSVSTGNPAYLLFTSGSTGRPKGVPISHAGLAHYFGVLDARYDFGPADVFSQTFDLTFDCAMFDLFCAWGAGAKVVPVPGHDYRRLAEFVSEQGITVWFATPSAISVARRFGGLAEGTMPSLRWSFFAGEALKGDDAADWQRAAPGSTLENLYGPTELTITVCAYRWDPARSPAACVNGVVPIGRVHEGHGQLILDGNAPSAEGELCITGPQLTAGYLDPGDNDGRFFQRDSRTWYRTGDRVRHTGDGELAYLGRLDSQVQVRGWRVELAEIEHALRGCAGVTDAVVVHETGGDGQAELVAFHTGSPVAPAELARGLRERLPEALVPRRFQPLAEFPLNANRKVDRPVLRARAKEVLGGA